MAMTYEQLSALTHEQLASLWCQWNGQKGTAKQSARIMRQLNAPTLARMLAERGIEVR